MRNYRTPMKAAMMTFSAEKKKADESVKRITDDYGAEAGKREQERQNKRLAAVRADAAAAIRAAYDQGIHDVNEWGKLDGGRLTPDYELLRAGLVDAETFEKLKGKYADNSTMLKALKKYGDDRNAETQKAAQAGDASSYMTLPFDTKNIMTLQDRLNDCEKAKAAAVDMLDAIEGVGRYSDPWNRAIGAAMGEQMIANFDE